jgi:hypothetical protein
MNVRNENKILDRKPEEKISRRPHADRRMDLTGTQWEDVN